MMTKVQTHGLPVIGEKQRQLLRSILEHNISTKPNFTELSRVTGLAVSTISDRWSRLERENKISLVIVIEEEDT